MVEISELGAGLQKVAIFRCLSGEEKELEAAVANYVGDKLHNEYVDIHSDVPNVRVVVSNSNNFGYKPYTGQTL